MYPAAEQDIGAAIAYLASHAGQYGIDPDRLMLLGHSAGAFLVALVSTDGVVRRAGRAATGRHRLHRPPRHDLRHRRPDRRGGTEEAMFRNAFGNDPAVWDRASPPHNVRPGKGIPRSTS